jgi:hypothetical protein
VLKAKIGALTYISGVKINGWRFFQQQLWQPSFYDWIIHSESELQKIRRYVEFGPVA